MTVYVDDMRAPYGRYIMCHMIADTEAELHAMADRIGVARRWHQRDHYDIALSKRTLAVAAGAVEITWRDASLMMAEARKGRPLPSPELVPHLLRELQARARLATHPTQEPTDER